MSHYVNMLCIWLLWCVPFLVKCCSFRLHWTATSGIPVTVTHLFLVHSEYQMMSCHSLEVINLYQHYWGNLVSYIRFRCLVSVVHRMLNTDHMQLLKSIAIHHFVTQNLVELLLFPLKKFVCLPYCYWFYKNDMYEVASNGMMFIQISQIFVS